MSTFYFNCMGSDDATGVFSLKADPFDFGKSKLDLTFTDTPANQRVYKVTEEILKAMAEAMGGRYVPWFTWQGFQNHKLITVHPLGGCPMDTADERGVVDRNGQVHGYPGLFIADGSVMPGPVVANPALTIAALSRHFSATVIRNHHEGMGSPQ